MTKAPDQGWRRARLAALAEHDEFRGRAPLGRALGYKDGAYIRQMIEGERAISEKTITAIETMRGGRFKGWFDKPEHGGDIHLSIIDHDAPLPSADMHPPAPPPPPPPPDFADGRTVSDSDWATLEAVKLLLPENELAELRARAERLREQVLRQIGGLNSKTQDKERK